MKFSKTFRSFRLFVRFVLSKIFPEIIRSRRDGSFCLKIVEIGATLSIFPPLENFDCFAQPILFVAYISDPTLQDSTQRNVVMLSWSRNPKFQDRPRSVGERGSHGCGDIRSRAISNLVIEPWSKWHGGQEFKNGPYVRRALEK